MKWRRFATEHPLTCLAVAVTIQIYIFYHRGPQIRARSKFAQSLEAEREKKIEKVKELGMRRRCGV
ncbi:hypothetical protein V2W45_1407198 [Cenococcum geophilum]